MDLNLGFNLSHFTHFSRLNNLTPTLVHLNLDFDLNDLEYHLPFQSLKILHPLIYPSPVPTQYLSLPHSPDPSEFQSPPLFLQFEANLPRPQSQFEDQEAHTNYSLRHIPLPS